MTLRESTLDLIQTAEMMREEGIIELAARLGGMGDDLCRMEREAEQRRCETEARWAHNREIYWAKRDQEAK